MKPYSIITVLLCLSGLYTVGQDAAPRYFALQPPSHKKKRPYNDKVSNSLYKTIFFLDSREDTADIGAINVGVLNHPAKLKLRMPFQPQLQMLMDSLIDSSAGNGELLFQLRDFRFAEKTETRYCYLQVGLYAGTQGRYQRLSVLDTVMVIPNSNVTAFVQLLGNQILSDFLAGALSRKPEDSIVYNMREVLQYDSVEKSRIPVFNTTRYVDGIYDNYQSFSRQRPDRQGQIKTNKNGEITRIEAPDSTGKLVKLKSWNLYALVYEGKPFVATEYGYYPLKKENNNLFFTGKVLVAASNGNMLGAQLALGFVARAMTSGGYGAFFDMIIDPITGMFVHLRKLDPPQETP